MKRPIGKNVYEAAIERIRFVFARFPKVYVAFSGGKDSTVLLHLALEVAAETDRTVDAVFIDLEGQYADTIRHIEEMFSLPRIRPHWLCLPLNLRNAVSVYQPYWQSWDPAKQDQWIRPLPEHHAVVSMPEDAPYYRPRMEFEEMVPAFQEWLAGEGTLASLVGIRADESLNRFKAVKREQKKRAYENIKWSSRYSAKSKCTSFYPIYDWKFHDIWAYIGKKTLIYNRLYDKMRLVGIAPTDMRICQPYGDDQRKGLDLFHAIEPATWFRVVQRVSGANWGALYASQKIMGNKGGMERPEAFSSWRQYVEFLLQTVPVEWRHVYERRINVFWWWWENKGGVPFDQVPDEGDRRLEGKKQQPSWRRVALSLLKMDMGKSLSFGFCRADTDALIDMSEGENGSVCK
jgi:predicted phosphoadenosine phosphosulfate sulfurtransferase